jgi:tRNA(adenine34) deaminase
MQIDDLHFMREALMLAAAAASAGEIPVGALIVHHPQNTEPKIIGRGHNLRERDHDPTAHAEIVAMREAGIALNHWRLLDCTMYVTLEPCPMCAGAIVNARIPRLVYGAADPKAGAVETLFKLCTDPRLNHRVEVIPNLLADESAALLRQFFATRRK